ncbi:unnamed protein product [Symbiodinium microadriaticum]|nr:unnamed protein product [Symbiodinium microadriaticum]
MAMTACARHALWHLAANVMAEVQVAAMRLDVVLLGASVGAYKQASMWRSAAQVLQSSSAQGLEHSIISHNALLSSLGRSALWQSGLVLQASMACSSCMTCDVVTFNTLITSYLKGMHGHRAIRVLPMMKEQLVEPDQATFSSTILACKMVSAWQGALACVQGLSLGMGDRPCQDSRVLGAAMAACTKATQWEWALELLHTVDASSGDLDLVLCNTGMAACASGRSWRRALDLLQRLAGDGFRSDVVSLNTCMTASERADRWQGACELLSAARRHAQRLDSITFAAGTAACGAGAGSARWALAINMMASCQEQGVQVSAETLGTVLAALSGLSIVGAREDHNRWVRALQLQLAACGKQDATTWKISLQLCRDAALAGAVGMHSQAQGLLRILGEDADAAALCTVLDTLELAEDFHGASALLTRACCDCFQLLRYMLHSQVSSTTLCAQAVLTMDSLSFRQRLPCAMQAAFHRAIAAPVLARLVRLLHIPLQSRNEQLEAQPMLGHVATMQALSQSCLGLQAGAMSNCRLLSRRCLTGWKLQLPAYEALATALAPCLAYSIPAKHACCAGRVVGYRAESNAGDGPLAAVWVQHDRSQHGERQALLMVVAATASSSQSPTSYGLPLLRRALHRLEHLDQFDRLRRSNEMK